MGAKVIYDRVMTVVDMARKASDANEQAESSKLARKLKRLLCGEDKRAIISVRDHGQTPNNYERRVSTGSDAN